MVKIFSKKNKTFIDAIPCPDIPEDEKYYDDKIDRADEGDQTDKYAKQDCFTLTRRFMPADCCQNKQVGKRKKIYMRHCGLGASIVEKVCCQVQLSAGPAAVIILLIIPEQDLSQY